MGLPFLHMQPDTEIEQEYLQGTENNMASIMRGIFAVTGDLLDKCKYQRSSHAGNQKYNLVGDYGNEIFKFNRQQMSLKLIGLVSLRPFIVFVLIFAPSFPPREPPFIAHTAQRVLAHDL